MKTETQTLEQKINSILSPARVLSADEWKEIAAVVSKNKMNLRGVLERHEIFEKLISRFESLTRGKWVANEFPTIHSEIDVESGSMSLGKVWQPALLTKEMFVCEVEKPSLLSPKHISQTYEEIEEYQAQQSKIWFEGFEKYNADFNQVMLMNSILGVMFNEKICIYIGTRFSIELVNPTVFDFIYQISKYNETAEKKIPVYYSINFIKELLK